ncbi:hypothetical protein RhoFasB10_03711 [Rhodococcus sp. B10]|nr:hypothetical protein [Rhodococcus sp. B10]
MVDDEGQHVFVGTEAQQLCAHRNGRRDVEALARDLGDDAQRVVLGLGVHRLEVRKHLVGFENRLNRSVVGQREHRTQRFVPLDDVGNGRAHRVDVQRSRHPHREGDVVRGRGRVVLVDEPHTLLCKGKRNRIASFHRYQRRTGFGPMFLRLDDGSETTHCRRIEQIAHRQIRSERRIDSGDEPHRDQ